MKLSQLIENFVISNDEFEDYLNRATEQLVGEIQSGKNMRDAIHDLALQFANQHNKAHAAYVRMSDALHSRATTLDADGGSNEPMADMSPTNEPEMMTDPMGDMEMSTPNQSDMPSDGDMEDYAAVMNNEPEAEEATEESEDKTEVDEARGNPMGTMRQASGSLTGMIEKPKHIKKIEKDEVNEETVNEDAMDTLKKIVADKQNMPVKFEDGQMKVDLYTASAISQVYDKVNDTNKAKLDDMMKTKAGFMKAADAVFKIMNKTNEEKTRTDELLPAAAGAVARGVGAAIKAAPKLARAVGGAAKVAKGVGAAKVAGAALKGAGNAVGSMVNRGSGGSVGSGKKMFNSEYKADEKADEIMKRASKLVVSEYNDFYQALDKAAKDGKKAGDHIEVGGKKIKLKSDPKRMSDLKDSDIEKIDALAQKINEN